MPAGSGDGWPRDYERGRPGWPPTALDVTGIGTDSTVLELGAGTGKLTRLLTARYARVLALEPADAMRHLLTELCPGAEPLAATAQRIPLPAGQADAVFAAEAFHWFQDGAALAEIARVLRPSGVLALLWNVPGGPWLPEIDAAEELLYRHGPDPSRWSACVLDLDGPHYTSGEWRRAFAGSEFGPLHEARFPNPQTLDRDGLLAFLASMGWIADLPDAQRLPLLDEVRSHLRDAEYRRTWETHVHWTRLMPVRG